MIRYYVFSKPFFLSNTYRFEKSNDLPSPRCRSLIFACHNAIFCVSGLIESRDENNIKRMKISTVSH